MSALIFVFGLFAVIWVAVNCGSMKNMDRFSVEYIELKNKILAKYTVYKAMLSEKNTIGAEKTLEELRQCYREYADIKNKRNEVVYSASKAATHGGNVNTAARISEVNAATEQIEMIFSMLQFD